MSTTTSTTFDLERYIRAIEERDGSTQLSMYSTDATVTVADPINQPSAPRTLRAREEIAQWINEVTSRDMTHSVRHAVNDATGAAVIVACAYPDGTRVLCASVLELEGGLVADQTVVQVWDEA